MWDDPAWGRGLGPAEAWRSRVARSAGSGLGVHEAAARLGLRVVRRSRRGKLTEAMAPRIRLLRG